MSFINLLWLCLIFSEVPTGHCMDTAVWQLPRPSISRLQAISVEQSLLVSWLVNHSGLVGNVHEIQISRSENHFVIYNKNVSLFSMESDEYTWTWTSDLPLECVDHSVRIRHVYNQSVLSPWSNWITNYGAQPKDKTKAFPVRRVLREGSRAMFCCVPSTGVNITSITLNNHKYPPISIGARAKAISVDSVSIPKAAIKVLSLRCRDSAGQESYAWNYVSFPPQKPRNISCLTSDMTTVTCTWDSGRKRIPHDRNQQTRTLHIENLQRAPIHCEQSSCTFPAVPHLEEYNIRVVVKDQLGEETESYSFNISDTVFPVVEWDRVSLGVTDATLSWIVQGNLTWLNHLCQVTTDPDSTTELSCNSVSGLCKVKLEHLLPNTRYSARVRCSVNGRRWGALSRTRSFITHPLVTLDVWRRIKQTPDPSHRQVTLLWTTHVPGSGATVNIQGYTVQWSHEGQNWTEWKDSGQTQAEVSIGPGQYAFTVQAGLHTGSSMPAHITIPQRNDGENLPVEKRMNNSTTAGFNLSWEEQDTATCGYTVEWCLLGNVEHCTLRWRKTPKGNNTLFLPARNFKAGCRYIFNIYGCTEHGHSILQIQTGYLQELYSVQSPSLVKLVQSTSSSVTVEWHYNEDDLAHSAFITGYLVTVQEVGSGSLPGHTANLFNLSVADPRSKSVTIEGLQHSQEYTVSVSALTRGGPGRPASITIRTRTNYSAHVAKILTIFLLLGCTILLWPQRKVLKSGIMGIFAYPAGMSIKTPELDSFLQETAERLQSQTVEECVSCDIEILNTRLPLNETAPLRDAQHPNTLPPPTSMSLSCVPPQADYCAQAVIAGRPDLLQKSCILNKTYFYPEDLYPEENMLEAEAIFCEINEPSESL